MNQLLYPKIEKALYELNQSFFLKKWSFNFDKFSQVFKDHFGLSHAKISALNGLFRLKENINLENSILYPVSISPIEGTIYLLISEKTLNAFFLEISEMKKEDLTLPSIKKGLTDFILLKIITLLSETSDLKSFSLKRESGAILNDNAYFAIPLVCEINTKILNVDLLLDLSFKNHFNEYFKNMPAMKEDLLQNNLPLDLRFTCGKTYLSQKELNELKQGDFLVFDQKSYDPKQKKTRVLCTIQGIPLFYAKVKNNQIKILEYVDFNEINFDKTSFEEISMEEETPFNEDQAFEEEITEEVPAAEEKMEAKPLSKEEKMTPLKKLPVCIVAEMARIQMPMNKVLELQEGNMLPITLNPDEPINLTINNALIGKAELVYIGETLGMRILSIEK